MSFVFNTATELDDFKDLFVKLCEHDTDTLDGDEVMTISVAAMLRSTQARNFLFATVIDGSDAVAERLSAVAFYHLGESSVHAMELLAVRAIAHNEQAKALALINAARGYVEPSGIADAISKALARESWEWVRDFFVPIYREDEWDIYNAVSTGVTYTF